MGISKYPNLSDVWVVYSKCAYINLKMEVMTILSVS